MTFKSIADLTDYQIAIILTKSDAEKTDEEVHGGDSSTGASPQELFYNIWSGVRGKSDSWVMNKWAVDNPESLPMTQEWILDYKRRLANARR